MANAIEMTGAQRYYELGGETVRALNGVDFAVPVGQYVSIMGPSGSGKTTLLNLLGCLDRPTSGRIMIGGEDVSLASDDRLSEIRSTHVGIIFQSYNLIPQLTVLDNIQIPLFYNGGVSAAKRRHCIELAERVGLAGRLEHRPTQLSGGQQQRVAIARSLVCEPYFILADEPTGNLDTATTEEILGIFKQLNQEGKTIVMVTHEEDVGHRADRLVRLRDGKIESDVFVNWGIPKI